MKILIISQGRNPEHLNDYESFTHKECPKCKEVKAVYEFSKSVAKNRIGWTYRNCCKKCSNYQSKYYAIHNRQKRNDRLKNYRKRNPDKVKLLDKRKSLNKNYGITIQQLEELKKHNNYKCWICNQASKKLSIDHCHTTGLVRGVLCPNCNTFLGRIKDNESCLEYAISYLRRPFKADILLKIANS